MRVIVPSMLVFVLVMVFVIVVVVVVVMAVTMIMFVMMMIMFVVMIVVVIMVMIVTVIVMVMVVAVMFGFVSQRFSQRQPVHSVRSQNQLQSTFLTFRQRQCQRRQAFDFRLNRFSIRQFLTSDRRGVLSNKIQNIRSRFDRIRCFVNSTFSASDQKH
jgi:hypothetical protein